MASVTRIIGNQGSKSDKSGSNMSMTKRDFAIYKR